MGDDPVDGGDDLRDVDGAGVVADLDVDDSGPGSDAGDVGTVVAGDDAGHVGAVSVGVAEAEVVVGGVEGEIGAVENLVAGETVDRHGAGVDHGDVDALTGVAGGVRPVGPHELVEIGQRSGGALGAVAGGRRAVEADRGRKQGCACGGGCHPDDGCGRHRDRNSGSLQTLEPLRAAWWTMDFHRVFLEAGPTM